MFKSLQLYESWQLCLHVYNYVKADTYVKTDYSVKDITSMWKLEILFKLTKSVKAD